MSELTLLLLRIGFLVLMWFFVFAVVYSLRADLFGVKVRKLPGPSASSAPGASSGSGARSKAAKAAPAAGALPRPSAGSGTGNGVTVKQPKATTENANEIIITTGPKQGLILPLGDEPLTIGRSSESGLVIRDDYTSSHHARLLLWGDQWMIQDLDSTNGTHLGSQRVTAPVPVTLNTPIKVGATTFELRS